MRPRSVSRLSSRARVRWTASGRPARPQAHDPHVQVLVVGVAPERGFQGGQGLVRVMRLEDLRDSSPGPRQ